MDENAQISAEMILIMGVLLIIVIVAGQFIINIAQQISGGIQGDSDQARDTVLNRM